MYLTTSKHTFKDTMSQDGNQNVVKLFVLITLVKKHHTCSSVVKVLGLQPPEHKFESESGLKFIFFENYIRYIRYFICIMLSIIIYFLLIWELFLGVVNPPPPKKIFITKKWIIYMCFFYFLSKGIQNSFHKDHCIGSLLNTRN